MRILLLAIGLLFTPSFHATAQISVEVVPDELEYLRDESMFVKVRIVNRSGQALKLGHTADWLTFNVQSQDGHGVEKTGEVPVTGEFTIESSQTAIKTVNLVPHYAFPQPGRYSVSATVKISQWNDDFLSAAKAFHVIRGVGVWEQEFGVPRKEGPPEVRQYSLVRATGMKQTRLYVRITDADDYQVFRVVSMGKVVSFGKPEAQVDRSSRLHVLFQNGPRSFFYGTFAPDGDCETRQSYDYTATRPTLRVNSAGKVIVVGGERRFMPTDIPALPSSGSAATNTPAPASSNVPKPVSTSPPFPKDGRPDQP